MIFRFKKGNTLAQKADMFFELSFEVCNKVGGIYTVLSTKASQMKEYYHDNYFLIGPYSPEKSKAEFVEEPTPPEFKDIFESLKKEGLSFHFGTWLIGGEPKVILINFEGFLSQSNEIKGGLWDDFKIDSLNSGFDFTEPAVFGFVCGKFLEQIGKKFSQKKIVAQFHEWLSGAGILFLKKQKSGIKTVFTTHATVVGRALAYNEVNFYPLLDSLDAEKEASNFFVKAKHQLEKAAALNCDVFSTVSEITALEAKKFLERAPDITLPNGLEEDKLFSFEELVERHRLQRTRLREFLIAFFFPYYNFDLENTLFYFLASRYEIKAKGIDVFIKSLSQLNEKLKAQKSEKTVVAFLLVPSSVKGVLQEVFENKQYFHDLKDSLEDISEETEEKILFSLAEGKEFSQKVLFSQNFLLSLRKKLLKLKRKGLPPLVTHELENENDSILQLLKKEGLLNKKEDKVKVVFYPDYLNGHDGLSNLNYEEMLQACHFGVFPSFYEPWGYTPLETAGFGVASLTTDLAGFGRFCLGLKRDKKHPGIFILQRDKKEEKEIIKDLTEILFNFSQYSKKERVENKIQARKIATSTDWKILAKKYIEAHNLCFLK